ncbi:hypothetical protein JAAARDRAFT_209876 [Jaapia argillacea MUCL 33604]|uniref:Adhesin domain-containing protein n=1 Tax=Jaapia argillacea MUCL 33604 TaxID=933084 RepID=A0A067PF38_9AGAM|nr:hypothetical protein JAAARDRAFT_209876 [Jaapia argillacea MUCL 33604]
MPNESGLSRTLSFWGMVGVVMTGLRLKERWDDYKQLSTEDGRISLNSPARYSDDDAEMGAASRVAALDTDIPGARQKRKRAKECCVCCGLRCGLFWKAFGIVCLIFLLWNTFKITKYAMTPSPTGLENMPEYSASLGCLPGDAPHLYNSSTITINTSMTSLKKDHSLDLRGGAVGTLVLAPGAPDQTDIKYEMTVRSNDKEVLDFIDVHYPTEHDADKAGNIKDSRFVLNMPLVPAAGSSCIRYDITVYIPQSLKKLHVQTHTPTHVQFPDQTTSIMLDEFYVTMYATTSDNMILPTVGIQAKKLKLEAFGGWIVGDVSIVDKTTITTRRGDGTMNVRVHPAAVSVEPPKEGADTIPPLPAARLYTTSGSGRTDISYLSSGTHRPINSVHQSSGNGDLYLTYADAGFNGKIDVKAKSYTMKGVQGGMGPGKPGEHNNDRWVGNKEGGDKLEVDSPQGWVGLYF